MTIRKLQRKLCGKAKGGAGLPLFTEVYDKVYRYDVLRHANRLAKAKRGAPSMDGEMFTMIEAAGLDEWSTYGHCAQS